MFDLIRKFDNPFDGFGKIENVKFVCNESGSSVPSEVQGRLIPGE